MITYMSGVRPALDAMITFFDGRKVMNSFADLLVLGLIAFQALNILIGIAT